MINTHLKAAIDELKQIKQLKMVEIEGINLNIHTLMDMCSNKNGSGKLEVSPQKFGEIHKRPKRTKKTSYANPQCNAGPVNLRLREIMADGKTKTAAEILKYFDLTPKDWKKKEYRGVLGALGSMVTAHLLVRLSKGVYRRNLKGVKKLPPTVENKHSNEPAVPNSELLLDSLRRSGALEFNARTAYEGLDMTFQGRYEDLKEFEKINRISYLLASLAVSGKLKRIREGVYTFN